MVFERKALNGNTSWTTNIALALHTKLGFIVSLRPSNSRRAWITQWVEMCRNDDFLTDAVALNLCKKTCAWLHGFCCRFIMLWIAFQTMSQVHRWFNIRANLPCKVYEKMGVLYKNIKKNRKYLFPYWRVFLYTAPYTSRVHFKWSYIKFSKLANFYEIILDDLP